jgi:hypothetical protein
MGTITRLPATRREGKYFKEDAQGTSARLPSELWTGFRLASPSGSAICGRDMVEADDRWEGIG